LFIFVLLKQTMFPTMKKAIIASLFFLAAAAFCNAQDIITTKSGEDIEAKILEVSPKEIKYKKFSNLEGPIFTLPVKDILIVRYETGENEIFTTQPVMLNTDKKVVPGMRYQDYKGLYDSSRYMKQPNDPYSPFWAGFGSFIIPGLGEAITGEWGRAAGFFFSNLGIALSQSLIVNDAVIREGDYAYDHLPAGYWILMAGRIGLNVWSICDSVKIAKIKDMYYQDMQAQRAALDIRLDPFFAYTPAGGNQLQPVTGFSLRLSF